MGREELQGLMASYKSTTDIDTTIDIPSTTADEAHHQQQQQQQQQLLLTAPKIYYLLYFSPSAATPESFLPFVTTDFAICHRHTSRGGAAKASTFASRGAAELKLAKKISLLPAQVRGLYA